MTPASPTTPPKHIGGMSADEDSSVLVEVEILERGELASLTVHKHKNATYAVRINGIARHCPCSAEDVMRALGNYLNSLSYKAATLQRLHEKPASPEG